jgi:TetR/AcrR family transcriptional regulator, transcriptional repressor for nem operon
MTVIIILDDKCRTSYKESSVFLRTRNRAMRVSRERAAENRDRIIDVAGRLFRERGFDGIGVADLMKAAGLTHGGFYGHFESKEDLEVQACERVLARSAWPAMAAKDQKAPLKGLLDWYLTARHRDRPGEGCLYAALAADVARRDSPALRRSFTAGLRPLIDTLVRIVPGRSSAARRQKALACLSAMVGAVILARAVDDAELSDEILAAARALPGEPSRRA